MATGDPPERVCTCTHDVSSWGHWHPCAFAPQQWTYYPYTTYYNVPTYVPPVCMPPISLRDWFAGQAMRSTPWGVAEDRASICANMARACYEIADAMLKAREGK